MKLNMGMLEENATGLHSEWIQISGGRTKPILKKQSCVPSSFQTLELKIWEVLQEADGILESSVSGRRLFVVLSQSLNPALIDVLSVQIMTNSTEPSWVSWLDWVASCC